jgi:hypothetical protein
MAFQLSPGVLVTEKDLTTVVPAVTTTAGAFAGAFQWGPVEEVTNIDSENKLVEVFGTPTDDTATSFFTAANFLSYGNNLQVVRMVNGGLNAAQHGSAKLIKNKTDFEYNHTVVSNSNKFYAKYAGNIGNALRISFCDSNTYGSWAYASYFDGAPGTSTFASVKGGSNDEMHFAVIDRTGAVTGTANTLVEKFSYVSKGFDARKSDGSTNYYKDVINNTSKYIWVSTASTSFGNIANIEKSVIGTTFGGFPSNVLHSTYTSANVDLSGGVTFGNTSGSPTLTDGNVQTGYGIFANDELYDVSLIPVGNVSAVTANWIIQNVAEVRKDCMVFVSPGFTAANTIGGATNVTDAVSYRNSLTSSSYGVMDSGWKYQYDRYNDVYRWIPLNGDTAGLCARTDYTNDPWFSPAGFNRGQIKSVVKLSYSPSKSDRDTLYKNGVNPVATFPGQGTVLFGDKTLLAKPSAFDRINVRRLFIVLEKAIATAAKFQLFEFNDAFTRAQFRNIVEPFLRDVQGRRGIIDFRVVCDDTNNTAEVIDRNEFVADIYVKPARSINFISLNFIATRTGISFEEIGA